MNKSPKSIFKRINENIPPAFFIFIAFALYALLIILYLYYQFNLFDEGTKWLILLFPLLIILFANLIWQIWDKRKNVYFKQLYLSEIHKEKAEERFRHLFENSPIGISIIKGNEIVDVNQEFCTILGYSKQELLGESWQKITHPDDIQISFDAIQAVTIRKESKIQFEKRYIHKDGSIIWTEINTSLENTNEEKNFYFINTINNITKRKLAEQALNERREELQTLFDSIDDFLFILNNNGQLLKTNPIVQSRLGYTEEELKKMSVLDMHPAAYRQQALRFLTDILEGKITSCPIPLQKKDGTIIPVETKVTQGKWGNSQVWFGISRDITERKLAEDALRENQRMLSTLLGNLPGIAYRCKNDSYWTMEYISQGCFELTGYHPEDLINNKKLPFSDLIIKEQKDTIVEKWQDALNMRKAFQDEYAIRNADGEIKWVLEKGCGIYSDNGEVIALEGFITDITERRMLETAMKESENRYRTIYETANDGFLTLENGVIIDCNKKTLELFKCMYEDVIGKHPADLSPALQEDGELSKSKALDKINSAIHQGAQMFEWKHMRKDRTLFDAIISLNKVDLGDRVVLHSIIRDITEQKASANKIMELNNELMEKNTDLEQLIFIASHDLRSPLVNIQGFNGELKTIYATIKKMLEEEHNQDHFKKQLLHLLETDIAESVNYIELSAEKMNALIAGLLKISRIGRTELNSIPIDMNEFFTKIIETFEFRIKEDNIKIALSKLPNCTGDLMLLDQLFSNLISNAIKFKSPDRSLKITITGSINYNEVVYCVEDNGIGFSPDYMEKIFMLFHRLNTHIEGEGIGLAIVKKIIDKHKGRVWAESEPQKGSKFYVAIPVYTSTI